MNIIRLNSTGDIIKKGGGSSKGGMKYYDCLFDEEIESSENIHGDYCVDNVKCIDFDTREVTIYPEAYNGQRVAVAVDLTNRKVYMDGQWMTYKDFLKLEEWDAFDPDTHIEITEEEFYHIPEDEVWMWTGRTYEENKVQFEKLMALCKRYGRKKIQSANLPLSPWFKSIDIETYDGYDSYYVHPQYLLDFAETKSVAYIKFNTPTTHNYNFCFLLKDGEYSIINQYQLEDMVMTVFLYADYAEREGIFNQLEAICQENVGNVNTSGVALSDYYPILIFEFCDEYDCTFRELDRIIGYEKDGDTTRIRVKTTSEYDEVIELVRDGGAYSGTFNGYPMA